MILKVYYVILEYIWMRNTASSALSLPSHSSMSLTASLCLPRAITATQVLFKWLRSTSALPNTGYWDIHDFASQDHETGLDFVMRCISLFLSMVEQLSIPIFGSFSDPFFTFK